MPSVNMISEEQAIGRIREIYEEIKAQLGIDFSQPLQSHGRPARVSAGELARSR